MVKRIRLLQIIYGFGSEGGGAARFAIDLSRHLNNERFETKICALWNLGTPDEQSRIQQLNQQGIEAFAAAAWDPSKPYNSFAAARKALQKYIEQEPVDIIHSHSEFGDVAALSIQGLRSSPKIIRTIHNGYQVEWRKRPLRRLFLTNLIYPLRFNQEIGVSQNITAQLNQRPIARLIGRRSRFIPNAIDLKRFEAPKNKNKKKVSLGLPLEAFVIGSTGRLSEEKGYHYLLEAAAKIYDKYPNVYFLLVGDGPLSSELKERSRLLRIDERVLFTGFRTDVEELLDCMDLFVSPSLWEGLPTAILESMAAGTAVAATDIPANRNLVIEGSSGWLFAARDADSLASAITQAVEEEETRKAFAKCSLELVKRFSIDTVSSEHTELYEYMMGFTKTPI